MIIQEPATKIVELFRSIRLHEGNGKAGILTLHFLFMYPPGTLHPNYCFPKLRLHLFANFFISGTSSMLISDFNLFKIHNLGMPHWDPSHPSQKNQRSRSERQVNSVRACGTQTTQALELAEG